MTAEEAMAWPNQDEMEYSIQHFQGGDYWDWELGGQKWFPLEVILRQQTELAKPQWLHLGYRVIERRKAGPPRVVNPDQLKDAIRLPDPKCSGSPIRWQKEEQAMTITEFLEARIAEDERAARSASPGPWSYSDIASVAGGTIYDPTVAIASVGYDVDHVDSRIRRTRPDWQADATGRHIARHDPARVLAECAAKRAIIAASHWKPRERPTDAELHFRSSHPAYEYRTTEGQRKAWDDADEPPQGEGWERNTDSGRDGWDRFDFHEESYWRRLKPEDERKEWKQYIPSELLAIAAVYADHPDYRQDWGVEHGRN